MILLIDNYDSFVYNLMHFMGELGADIEVRRNDELGADEAMALQPDAIVISPGPCDPDKAGICLELIEKIAGQIPLFGVCLGHQCIGQAFGGRVVRAPVCMHGKLSRIYHDGTGVFAGLPSPFEATRYHSLVVERGTIPEDLEVNAWTEDGVAMGVRHRALDIHGVQFHPESIASEQGHRLLANFLASALGYAPTGAPRPLPARRVFAA